MDQQVIDDLYNRAVSQGYKKNKNEFINLLHSDNEVFNDMYSYVKSQGYKKSTNDFSSLIGKTSTDVEEPLKKKEQPILSEALPGVGAPLEKGDTESTLPSTSLGYTEQSNVQPQQKGVPAAIAKPAPAKEFIAPAVEETTTQLKQLGAKPSAPKDFFDKSLDIVNKDLIAGEEENAVPKLNYHFGDYGFKFEKADPLGDAMTVTAPNGKKLNVDLDPFFTSGSTQAEELKQFLKENKVQSNKLNQDVEQYQKGLKKYIDEKETKADLKQFDDDLISHNQQVKDFVKAKALYDQMLPKYANMTVEDLKDPAKKAEYDAFLQNQKGLQQLETSVINNEKTLKTKQKQLTQSIGAYTAAKAEEGDFGGFLLKNFLNAAGSVSSALASNAIDLMTAIGIGKNPKEYQDKFIEIAKSKGLEKPSDVDFETWKKSINEDTKDAIESKVKDIAKKESKKEIIDKSEMGTALSEKIGPKTTTQEYINKKTEEKWGYRVTGALAQSAFSMMSGPSPATMASFYLQSQDALRKEMNDPKFDNISENEKQVVSALIGIPAAILEEFGFRNAIGNKGLLNGIIARALGKSAAGATEKSFEKFVRQDIDNLIARGLLTIGAAGLSEFETGAAQELEEEGVKWIYNQAKKKDLFQAPQSWSEYFTNILAAGRDEMVGGFIMGTIPGVANAAYKHDFTKISDAEFEIFQNISKDPEYANMFKVNLEYKVSTGEITAKEAKEQLDNYNKVVGAMYSVPENFSTEQKKKALGLVTRKQQLENEIQGKDPALVKKQKSELEDITKKLENISESVPEYTIGGEQYTKDKFLDKIKDMSAEELSTAGINIKNDNLVLDHLKDITDAIQKPSTEEAMLQFEQFKLGLQEMGKGNAQEQPATQEGEQVTTTQEGEVVPEQKQPATSIPPLAPTQQDEVAYNEGKLEQTKLQGILSHIAEKLNNEKDLTEFENKIATENNDSLLEMMQPAEQPVVPGVNMSDKTSVTSLKERVKDATKLKIVETAERAVNTLKSIFPDFDLHIHDTEDGFNATMGQEDIKGNVGAAGNFSYTIDDNGKIVGGRIDINLNKASARTVAHEIAHAVLLKSFGSDVRLFTDFQKNVSKLVSSARNKKLLDFISHPTYSKDARPEEYLAELTGILNEEKDNLSPSLLQKFAILINNTVSKITGGRLTPFQDTADAKEIGDFLNTISQAVTKGEGITAKEIAQKKISKGVVSKAQMPMGATEVLYSDSEKLPKSKKKIENAEVAQKLQDTAVEYWGGIITSDNITEEQEKEIVENGIKEGIAALKEEGNASDWYSTAIDVAMKVAGILHPELSSEKDASKYEVFAREKDPVAAAQLAMRMALAITSQNLNVEANTNYAEEQFDYFKKNGKFDPSKTYGEKGASISSNLELANTIVEKMGLNAAEDFIKSEFTVSNLEKEASQLLGKNVKITGLKNDIINGAALFGPKIGQGFLQNLMGNYNPVTIDLWMRRTWGRWTGDVVGDGITEDRMGRFLSTLKQMSKDIGVAVPDYVKKLKPIEKTDKKGNVKYKNGNILYTMNDKFLNKIENDAEYRQKLNKFVKDIQLKANTLYKAIHDIPMSKELYDDFISGKKTYAQVGKELISFNEKLGNKYNEYASKEKANKRKPINKKDWIAEQYKKIGRKINVKNGPLTNNDISERKPEWAKASTVIVNDLNPIDIPSNQDRRVISRIVNKIRERMTEQGYPVTNADVQAILWYPEKDIWAKLRGEEKSKDKLSYDGQFIKIAKERGLGQQAERIAEQVRSERAARVGSTIEQGANVPTSGQATKVSKEAKGTIVSKAQQAEKDLSQKQITEDEKLRSERRGDGGRRYSSGGLTPLEGAPTKAKNATGPDEKLVSVAEDYARKNNIDLRRQSEYVDVDLDRAKKIANAYEEMPHSPNDPKVKEAYNDLIKQTKDQYQALDNAGYEFTFFDDETDPYDGNPWNAMRDLRNNKKMAVYSTAEGFGTEGITATELENNPMLQETGIEWKDQKGVSHPVLANDLFRAVHDAFGHGLEGAGFRARGEENAWQAHVRLFTGPAIKAITTETRGQNSWLNYGPYGQSNINAKIGDTVFAAQKTGLMPEWTWTEGRAGDMEIQPTVISKAQRESTTQEGKVKFGTAFEMQDNTAENTVGKDKDKWGESQLWRERIENAGDILRELSSRGDKPDPTYILEKVNKIKQWLDKNKKQPIEKIPNDIKTLDDFKKTNLKFTNIIDGYEYLTKFNSDILKKTKKEYEAIHTYTKEQRLATDLVLDLINNNINGLESKLNKIEEIANKIKKEGKLEIIPDIKIGSKLKEPAPKEGEGKVISKAQQEAWHGSPHEVDKFTTEKIGTGEGNQAFGWGLYFTDLESIARSYAKALSKTLPNFKGKTLNILKLERDFGKNNIKYRTLSLLNDALNSVKGVATKKDLINYINENTISIDKERKEALDLVDSYDEGKSGRNLYKVILHEGKTPDQYTWLEWDKPLSKEQKKLILNQAEKEGIDISNVDFDGDGRNIYTQLGQHWYFNGIKNYPKETSLFLLRSGIDGVKYPAESISRGATSETARGSNYVVFDENAISIKTVSKAQRVQVDNIEGYERMQNELDGVIEKSRQNGRSVKEIMQNALNYVMGSKVYDRADDSQREQLVRDVYKKLGVRVKSTAPVAKILGHVNNVKSMTMTDKMLFDENLKSYNRGSKDMMSSFNKARKAIVTELKELVNNGKITIKQATSILDRFAKVDMFNDDSVAKFVSYADRVFKDAQFAEKLSSVKKKLKTARENIKSKIGSQPQLHTLLNKLFSINPELIPAQVFDTYTNLVEMFGERAAVLTLQKDIDTVLKDAYDIIDAVNAEQSIVEELSDVFDAYDKKVLNKDGSLNFSDTLKSMLKDGIISEEDLDLMKKYKSDIVERLKPEPMSEDELAEEKQQLIDAANDIPVKTSQLEMQDEIDLVEQLKSLMTDDILSKLTNQQLKDLLKTINNINNGYVTAYANTIKDKMESIKNAKDAQDAIENAKVLPLTKALAKIKALFNNKKAYDDMVKEGKLFFLDQLLGDFKSKKLFNALFKSIAQQQAKFESQMKQINAKLDEANVNIANSFNKNPNKITMSKYKIMTYLLQKEFESNPGNDKMNPASKFLKATIDLIDGGNSNYSDKDAEMLQEILKQYSTDGEIDINKLYNSFNQAEKDGIKTIQSINKSLLDKALFTAAVIRGQKINPIKDYIHLNTIRESNVNEISSEQSLIQAFNNAMKPSTKSKTLIERTGEVSALNFDPFVSVNKGAKSLLMDYYLTSPIRTARGTLSYMDKSMSEKGRLPKETRDLKNAIKNAFEESISNFLTNTYENTTFVDSVIQAINRIGYKTILASTTRFVAELKSNISGAMIYAPKAFMTGVAKYKSLSMSKDGLDFMNNIGSVMTNRLYASNTLSNKFIDSTIMDQALGTKGSQAKNDVANIMQTVYNNSLKHVANFADVTSDALVATPDKVVMRPTYFGVFANEFKRLTGEEMDQRKISSNDKEYMSKHKDAIEKSRDLADQTAVFIGNSENPFLGTLKGKGKITDAPWKKAFNNFNSFMVSYSVNEYVTARTAIYAMVGKGMITKEQGARLLASVVIRNMVYTTLAKTLGSALVGLFVDDDDEDEKSLLETIMQSLASTMSGLLLGRDFGNAARSMIGYGVEEVNKNYLDFLREGEYDPYKDAIMFSTIPLDEKQSNKGAFNMIANMAGGYAPAMKTANLIFNKLTEKEKESIEAQDRVNKEKTIRIPLEIAGNAGFVPFYKDIRRIVNADIYKDIDKKGTGGAGSSSAQPKVSQEDLKKYYPDIYKTYYSEESPYKKIEKKYRDIEKKYK